MHISLLHRVSWTRFYPYTLFGLALFLGMLVPFLLRSRSEWDTVFVLAAQHLRDGAALYERGDGYSYPPFMALLSIPFTFLPPWGSRLVFYLVNGVCLVVLCRCAWRIAGGGTLEGPTTQDRREHFIWLLGLACAFRYALDAIAHQQTDLIIGALVMAGCLALYQAREWTAATWLGLAAAMKCTPLLWCLYLVWRRRWLPALWLLAVALGVNLLPELVSRSPRGGLWLENWTNDCVLAVQNPGEYPGAWHSDIIYNQSLAGLAQRWLVLDWAGQLAGVVRADALSPRTLRALVLGSDLLLVLLAAWAVSRRPQSRTEAPLRPALEYSVVLLLMLLLSPMSSKPHFCPLLLPAFCLARLALVERRRVQGVLLGLATVAGVVATRDLVGVWFSSQMLWWGTVTWSALFLLAGCLLELCRPRPTAEPKTEIICGRFRVTGIEAAGDAHAMELSASPALSTH